MIRDFTETTLNELKDIIEGAIDEYFSEEDDDTYHGMLAHAITVAEENCVANLADIELDAESGYNYWKTQEDLTEEYKEKLDSIFKSARDKDTEIADTVDEKVSEVSDSYLESLKQLVNSIDLSALGDTESEFNFNRGYYHSTFSNSIFGDPDSFSEKMDEIKGGVSTQLYDYLSTFKENPDAENSLKELVNKPIDELSMWEIDALCKMLAEYDLSDYYEVDSLTAGDVLYGSFSNGYYFGKSLIEIAEDLNNLSEEDKEELLTALTMACALKDYKVAWKVIKRIIPQYATDTTILDVYEFITDGEFLTAMWGLVDHNVSNTVNWESKKGTVIKEIGDKVYIENQEEMTFLEYGFCNADYNSCEVIAYYNAMTNKGKVNIDDFPQIISEFEAEGTAAGGKAGTSPNTIETVLEKHGVKADLYTSDDYYESNTKIERRYDTYIITVYNDENDVEAGVHTMCITKDDNGQYILHNDYSSEEQNRSGPGYSYYDSIDEAIEGYNSENEKNAKLITIIGVD